MVAALADVYPGLRRIIAEHASENGRALLDRLHHMTTVEAMVRLWRTDMGDMLDQPLEQILSTPEVQHVFADIKLGVAVPTPPVLIIQAVHDEIISVDGIDELAETYASGGAHVTYHRDMFSEHLLLHPLSAPMALRWLSDRFAGRPLGERLLRTKWPTMFNPSTYKGMARLAVITAKVLTGRKMDRLPLSVLDR
ncbi:MAG: lipase [Mycobacterium sp.]|nr:lipase [Mycobacterium sp.]